MWILIIVAIIICCIVAGIAQSQEDANNERKVLIEKQSAAKRPDAFIRLFKEEFPDYASDITFSKAEAAINEWTSVAKSNDFTQHLKFFNKNEFKDSESGNKAMSLIVGRVSYQISYEFYKDLQDKPVEQSYVTLRRVIISSQTLAGE